MLDESPDMIDAVYKDYDKIDLWKREREDSPFAGVDRIRAHFQGTFSFPDIESGAISRESSSSFLPTPLIGLMSHSSGQRKGE